jgi:hypothetical protein
MDELFYFLFYLLVLLVLPISHYKSLYLSFFLSQRFVDFLCNPFSCALQFISDKIILNLLLLLSSKVIVFCIFLVILAVTLSLDQFPSTPWYSMKMSGSLWLRLSSLPNFGNCSMGLFFHRQNGRHGMSTDRRQVVWGVGKVGSKLFEEWLLELQLVGIYN